MGIWRWFRDQGNHGAVQAIVAVAGLLGGLCIWTVAQVGGKEQQAIAEKESPPALQRESPPPPAQSTPEPQIAKEQEPSVKAPESDAPVIADKPAVRQTDEPMLPPAASTEPKPTEPKPRPSIEEPLPSKSVSGALLKTEMGSITVEYSRGYIRTSTTVTVTNTSPVALQIGLHSIALQLGDGKTLVSVPNRVVGLPNCLGGWNPHCGEFIRSTEAIPPAGSLAFTAEFQKAVGLNASIGKKGTATLTGVMWALDRDKPDAMRTQARISVSGIEQDFAF